MRAVNGVSFSIEPGQVVGFIGANGAGKTTTMRMLSTLEIPSDGVMKIAGNNVIEEPAQVRRHLGWMPDHYGTYPYVTVREYLDFFARAYGFRSEERKRRVNEVMEFADLTPLQNRLMNTLSKGMGQRLCFGRTLLHDPEVLILDEPAAGLDPKARLEFKNLVRLLKNRGKTVFISSHILSELGEMCDSMLFIDQGRIVYQGKAEDLKRRSSGAISVSIGVVGSIVPLKDWVKFNEGWDFIRQTGKDTALVLTDIPDHDKLAGQLKRMIDEGLPIREFHVVEESLEDMFINILKEQEGASA